MNKIILSACASLAMTFVGCGGNSHQPKSSNTSTQPTSSSVKTSISATTSSSVSKAALIPFPISDKPLVMADPIQLSGQLQNGLTSRLTASSNYFGASSSIRSFASNASFLSSMASSQRSITSSNAASFSSSASSSNNNFSNTNVHVQNVDEADIVKYDGHYWYIGLNGHDTRYNYDSIPAIAIVELDPATATAKYLTRYRFSEPHNTNFFDFYSIQNNNATQYLAAIRKSSLPVSNWITIESSSARTSSANSSFNTSSGGGYYTQSYYNSIHLDFINVQQPAQPTLALGLKIEGSLIDSRRIGNTLYLISQHQPILDAESIRKQADLSAYMPKLTINGETRALTDNCLTQPISGDNYIVNTLTFITTIQLDQPKLINSVCVNSPSSSISVSERSLYLFNTINGVLNQNNTYDYRTSIHKFSLKPDGAHYEASGNVAHLMNGPSDTAFKVHEKGNMLRVVTTNPNNSTHHLTILEQKNNALEQVSILPNETRPEPIGKPGETIRSVRFDDDFAYIVTFRNTDPLYKIDLSNPKDPKIVGELEISGFATYLHPLGNGYAFSLGQEADSQTGRVLGIKAELLDVSGDKPMVIDKLILGGVYSQSSAINNLKALTILTRPDGTVRIAFPLITENYNYRSSTWSSSWSSTSTSSTSTSRNSSSSSSINNFYTANSAAGTPLTWLGIKMLEITGLTTRNARLYDAGQLKSAATYDLGLGTRGLLHDDAVYMAGSGTLMGAFWGKGDKPTVGFLINDPSK